MSINNWTFSGRLGQDAEGKSFGDNKHVTNFSVAVVKKYKDSADGQWKESTTWVRCALWNREKLTQYLTKGSLVVVSGEPKATSYESNGETKTQLECTVFDIDWASKQEAEDRF